MRGILLLAILAVKSSYVRNVEEELSGPDDIPDTVQWWITAEGAWRIKTFALDHDIHTHAVRGTPQPNLLEIARANTEKHYGDAIAQHLELHFEDCTDAQATRAILADAGLEPRIEIAADQRFAFWKPDEARYRSQSAP